jgi:histone H3/H4
MPTICPYPRVSCSGPLHYPFTTHQHRSQRRRPFRDDVSCPFSSNLTDIHPATVQKIVSEILPPATGVAFSKEARDLLIECCVEFITLISSEANEISEKEAKKTIACDHITKALEQLGFADYVPAVLEAAAEHKEVQKVGDDSALLKTQTAANTCNRGGRKKPTSSQIAACRSRS